MKTLIIHFIFSITICIANAAEFNVAIEEFSYALKPESFQYHPMVFILKQLHEPLFTRTSEGIRSNILSNWVSSSDFKEYQLCLKPDVYFSNDKKLNIENLKQNLEYFSKKKYFTAKVDSIGVLKDCIKIKFQSSYYGFIDDLQSLKMSIIDLETVNNEIPVGISEYKVESYTKQKLTLRARNQLVHKPYFDIVNIIAIGSSPQKIDTLLQFQEINLLRSTQLPSQNELKMNFKEIEIYDIQGVYILLNHKDNQIRELMFNCINRESLSKALNLDVKSYPNTILPEESGVSVPFIQNCRSSFKFKSKRELNLLYYYEKEKVDAVAKAFSDIENLNIKIKLNHKSKSDAFIDLEKKNYDVAIIRIDGFNFLGQFDALGLGSSDKLIISSNVKNKNQLRSDLINGNRIQREQATKTFISYLFSDFRLIPVARLKVRAFYPDNFNLFNDNNSVSFYEYQIKNLGRK